MSYVDTTVQPRQAMNLQKATLLHCAAGEGERERPTTGGSLFSFVLAAHRFVSLSKNRFVWGEGERRRGVWRGRWADKRSHPSVFNIFHLFYTCYLLAASASASPCISSPLRLSLSLSLPLCLISCDCQRGGFFCRCCCSAAATFSWHAVVIDCSQFACVALTVGRSVLLHSMPMMMIMMIMFRLMIMMMMTPAPPATLFAVNAKFLREICRLDAINKKLALLLLLPHASCRREVAVHSSPLSPFSGSPFFSLLLSLSLAAVSFSSC